MYNCNLIERRTKIFEEIITAFKNNNIVRYQNAYLKIMQNAKKKPLTLYMIFQL